MKTSSLSFLALILVLLSGCQQQTKPAAGVSSAAPCSEYRVHILHYENSGGERGITTNYYDARGVNHLAVWELLDGSRNSLNFHTFDNAGHMIQKYREFLNGLTTTETYRYDSTGRLITEIFDRSDGVYGETEYTYDEQGRESGMHCNRYKGWLTCDIRFEHDQTGRKTRGIILDDTIKAGQIDYSYDANGCLSRAHWDFSGRWSQTFDYQYERVPEVQFTSTNPFVTNNNRFRVSGENYDYSGKTGGPSYFEYDPAGKLLKKRFVRSDSLTTETWYEYSTDGRLTQSTRHYSDGQTAIFSYEYDDDRNLIRRSFRKSDGVTGSDGYEYDEHGRLLRAVYANFDTWLTGTITFVHDNLGTLTGGHFSGADGFDAKITFEHDRYRNITRVHWDFSFGGSQTYEFRYEKLY